MQSFTKWEVMKIEFCLVEDGSVIFNKDSKDLKDIINVITRVGTEIKISFSKDQFIHGFVTNVMYIADAEENDESLRIYFTKDFSKHKAKDMLSPEKLSVTKIKDKLN